MASPEPLRALIVEDDPVVARSVARRLLREGYTVSMAGPCRAAPAAGRGFQIAVLDLDLPDGSGVALAEELLRHGAVRALGFYTGSVDMAQRERAALYGPVIDKGQELEDLLAALEPCATEPPASRMEPSPRARGSGARMTRVLPEDAPATVAEPAASSRTSSFRR
jgi:CheY-like chemotaxis protein